jgi:predicted metal-dependent peptidase
MAALCTQAAAVRMTMKYAFWCELFYSMDVIEVHPGDPLEAAIQTLATDGKKLWVNVNYFNKETLDMQVADLVHELGHKMLLHPTRQGFRDPDRWNQACDYAINGMLKDNGFTLLPVEDWLYDTRYHGMLAEAIYADLTRRERDQDDPPPPMPTKRKDLVKPQGTEEQIAQQEEETKALVDRAVANALARGDLPAGVEGATTKAYKEAREPWYNHLHRFMQSLASSGYNWARLNRRTLRTHGFFSPHHMSESLGEVLLLIDGSGSCFTAAAQENFAEHVNAIMAEAKPKKIIVGYFDTKVYEWIEYEPGLMEIELKPKGGGGTSFRRPFAQVREAGYDPAVMIVLTDMLGTYPDEEPDCPVIWADVLGHDQNPPFGEYILVQS